MKTIKKIFIIVSFVLFSYVFLPRPTFPSPPDDALQSQEPGDTEDPLRRAYFTNLTREEVVLHYKKQFTKDPLFSIPLPTYRLNYPPEDAQILIRDQTRSTFLEEITHPFRESFFINGFEPKTEKDTIIIQDKLWKQKITVKYVQSNRLIRLLLIFSAIVFSLFIYREYKDIYLKVKK